MPLPRVIVTRPAHDAARWVTALAAHGVAAEALPLIDIVPEPMAGELAHAREDLGGQDIAMFVSGNAVDGFLSTAHGPAPDTVATRAWSPGPGTTAALRAAGWPPARIDAPAADAAQFDSESLWEQVHGQVRPGLRVLIVRGGDAAGRVAGRDWLAAQLAERGAVVEQVVAYRRASPAWDEARRAHAASAAADGSLWLLSSSEAIANLGAGLPQQDWSGAAALATHPRIARAARQAGFGTVRETRPTLDAVVASIESMA